MPAERKAVPMVRQTRHLVTLISYLLTLQKRGTGRVWQVGHTSDTVDQQTDSDTSKPISLIPLPQALIHQASPSGSPMCGIEYSGISGPTAARRRGQGKTHFQQEIIGIGNLLVAASILIKYNHRPV